jgi:phage/plasmid-like protein (TIGR03299 family)
MFSVRKHVWWEGTDADHGQASILGDHPTFEEARREAGLDWDPADETLHRPADIELLKERFEQILANVNTSAEMRIAELLLAAESAHPQIPGWKHVYRDDSEDTLACTMDSYPLITNGEFGEIFEAVMEQPNVKYETGGCLDGGRRVWMLALLDEPLRLPGDDTATYPFLAIQGRHDARGAVTLRSTNVRIVCSNTFDFAEMQGERTGLAYSFVHRGDWRDRVSDAREAVNGVRASAREYQKLACELLTIPVTPVQTQLFVAEFFKMPPKGLASDRVIANVENSRDELRTLIYGPTVEGAGIGGTAYGLVQASGEYLDHVRKAQSWETKLNRQLLKPEPLKARALQIVREVCAATS